MLIGESKVRRRKMMAEGVFTIGFGFPVVSEGTARVRLQFSDALGYEELDHALAVIQKAFLGEIIISP
ncbi:MAG: hypothetical protein FWG99_05450 [Treponema sp.]|nr:hypothetical protein [Treponema sp.]